MGTILFHVLAYCFLVISFVEPRNDTTESTTDVTSNGNDDTTTFATVTTETFSATTVQPQTSHSTLLSTGTSDTNTPTFNVSMTATSQTTAVDTSTPDTVNTPGTTVNTSNTTEIAPGTTATTSDNTVITTANTSHTANTTSNSDDRITHGVGFNNSEKNITIVLSVALGAFAVAFVIFMFHRCKHKAQYLHQPFHNTDDPDAFEAGNDTLVISGGLYDGHPIYDNVPTAQEDQSQFRLQFFH